MRRLLLLAIALASCSLGMPGAQAQSYPSRTITIIVPFPPGGSTDTVARIMAEGMQPILGQPVIIENVGGAGGSTAVGRLARAAPDGYTIDIGQWDTHVGSIIYKIAYDLEKDFAPVGLISVNPQLMVAKKTLEANDLKGLVAWMKANPGKGTVRQPERGGARDRHPAAEGDRHRLPVRALPRRRSGHDRSHRGAGRPAGGAGGGRAAAGAGRHHQGHRQPVAAALRRPYPTSPRPTKTGVPGLYMSGWFGFFAPKGTPAEAIGKLNAAMVQVLADPAIRARFAQLGLDVASREQQTPEGLAAFHKVEIDKWWPIIKAAGIAAE